MLTCPYIISCVAAMLGVLILSHLTKDESVWYMWVKLVCISGAVFYVGCVLYFGYTGLRCVRGVMRARSRNHEPWTVALRKSANLCAIGMLGAWPGALLFATLLWMTQRRA